MEMREDLVGFVKYMRRTITPWHTSKEIADMLIANDVVPVVRCKDCWKSADGLCSYQLKNVPGKDFCGDGERKNNG